MLKADRFSHCFEPEHLCSLHNWDALEMYEFVKHEFHKNYDSYCTEADLTRFQWLNANYNRVRNTFS